MLNGGSTKKYPALPQLSSPTRMSRPVLNVLLLSRLPIYNQLHLEEALLRATKDNWLIVNDGAFDPAIVVGISGRPPQLIDCELSLRHGIQAIRRFTGGGTVVVDHDTLFSTLIMQGSALPDVDCFPQPIMAWTERIYRPAFAAAGCPDFALRENDYIIGDGRKVGGNAQAITGRRWLHHTSFLWDFDPQRMALLRQPAKAPQYRQGRTHLDFVARLRDVLPMHGGRQRLLDAIVGSAIDMVDFEVQERTLAEASAALQQPQLLLGTKLLDLRQFTTRSD
ncbi:hypothetical protein VOLCADRAFT_103956 [Volvox carteri f. nagariensis]|uniref:BPL/LPL catalytic domain-containing protein n=1 Tax=Volvox carteri f. nagariensis TaxID=3068 RepID=D8TQ99_VOLCA|nr:uncharacterized protein VOLCADRAFT_103956 [Volvox carteri f. nagariensis]EFJ50368.1 hypothetical protein VOLCADRAFT_103956 [Volvox carteri f. nagariensis]|eukprot:XP_002948493.1 hypothetical protein VOLCADRAFT_103956 [Volvox carteri f. nagariensis]